MKKKTAQARRVRTGHARVLQSSASKHGAARRGYVSKTFTDVGRQLGVIEDVLSLLLRTCDDSIKSVKGAQKECLMAACDDVRAALGYTGRYLTPLERKRFGIAPFEPAGGQS